VEIEEKMKKILLSGIMDRLGIENGYAKDSKGS
jgi:hypothetical protein